MIDALNLLLLKKYEATPVGEASWEFIDHWLKTGRNYDRLQQECEKIWSRRSNDPGYDAERAFRLLGQRFVGVCSQETQAVDHSQITDN